MNLLIQDARILSPDFRVERGSVCVSGKKILSVGEIPAGAVFDRVIDGGGRLVIPGLINCHTHSYMSLFRNFADDLSFQEWLFRRVMPKEDRITPEDAYWCTLLACIEMIRSGTTCFLDMHMFRGVCMQAAAKAGMRAVFARGLVGEGADDPDARRRIDDFFYERKAAEQYDGLFSCMLGPHAIYTCGERLLRYIRDLALAEGVKVHIHLAETGQEFRDSAERHGCSPTAYLARTGLFDAPTAAAHCVRLTDEDISILRDHGVIAVTNPVSNMKLGNGFAPVPKLLKAGIGVAVGTDGAASNNNLNMFHELSVLSLIHKGLEENPEVLPAPQILRMATAAGAEALGLGGTTGKIRAGYAADLALIDLNCPQMKPENDLAAALVYSANGSEVRTVIIDGRIVLDEGRVTFADEREVFEKTDEIRTRILS